MNNLKNMVAALVMVMVMSAGTVFAGDGIIIGSRDGIIIGTRAERQTSTAKTSTCTSSPTNGGIVIGSAVAGFTGIVIGTFTGIVIGSAVGAGSTTTNCGIIIGT